MPGQPRVTVLLATHQGLAWLPEQVGTILGQQGVDVLLRVSDDASTDGTAAWLDDLAARDPRVTVLPPVRSGGAAPNFARLLRDVDADAAGLVALADQDDVWAPDKLATQVRALQGGYDGVSSDVTAFRPDGTRFLVRKSYPQRRLDWLFEGPGPGCSFVLAPRLVRLLQELLADPASPASTMAFHDWMVYGAARARGWPWLIEARSTLDYRQHDSNAFGAHRGLSSRLARLRLVRAAWHRREAALMARVGLQVAEQPLRGELEHLLPLLEDTSPRARAALARYAPHARRRPRDRAVLGALIAGGLW